MAKFLIEPHFRLQEWVAEEKGYFRAEGLDYEFRELVRATGGQNPRQGRQGRRLPVAGGRPQVEREPAPAIGRSMSRPRTATAACTPTFTRWRRPGIFVPPNSPIKTPADLAGVPISVGYQSGSHYATVQALEAYLKPDGIKLNYADGMLFARMEKLIDGTGAGGESVQRPLLLRRATRLPQDYRHHVHDRHHDHRRSRSGGLAQILPRLAQGAARHRPAARALHPLLQEGIPRALPRDDGYAALGTRRAACLRALYARKSTRSPSSGSPTTTFSPKARWGRDATSRRRCRWWGSPYR